MTYHEAIARELRRWPGVTVGWEHRGKHMALVVGFNGRERRVFCPASPSDTARGHLNAVGDLRRVLRELGANKDEN